MTATSADAKVTPHVQKKTSQGIPMLLPGPGISAVAGMKKTQAIAVDLRTNRTTPGVAMAVEVSTSARRLT